MASPSTDRRFGSLGTLAIKAPCKSVSTTNITLSGEQAVNGVSCVTGDRVLVTAQTSGVDNGIYNVDTGSWVRAPDWNNTYDIALGTLVKVTSGTYQFSIWEVTTPNPIVIGTTAITMSMNDVALLGDLVLTSGARILGDFSNTTRANRTLFKTSTLNNVSQVGVIPNGSGASAGYFAHGMQDPDNSPYLAIAADNVTAYLEAGKLGTAAYPPLLTYVGGAMRMWIDTSGRVAIGTPPYSWFSGSTQKSLDVSSVGFYGDGTNSVFVNNSYLDAGVAWRTKSTGGAAAVSLNGDGTIVFQNAASSASGAVTPFTQRLLIDAAGNVGIGGTPSAKLHLIGTNAQQRWTNTAGSPTTRSITLVDADNTWRFTRTGISDDLTIDNSGNVQVTGPGGLGYGTGSGGTVTQATSKATGVTLNKTNGQITMNNAALAANTAIGFVCTNSTCTSNDVVICNVSGGVTLPINYNVWASPGAGSISFYLKNISAGSLSEAAVISFAIIKAVAA